MKSLIQISLIVARKLVYIFAFVPVTIGMSAQDTSTTSVRRHNPSHSVEVRNAQVAYVEGNDLVLKRENGRIEHLVVPDSDRFIINGRSVTVHELQPGTQLTQTIVTTTTPHYVNTVRVLEGKVWHLNAPHSVIVSLPDGTNHLYKIPKNATFIVNGERKTVFELRKGMQFKATIVTDEPKTVVTRQETTFGEAPPPVPTRQVGVLLFQPVMAAPISPPAPAPVQVAAAEEPATMLPKTGSELPLMGLLGTLGMGLSFGLRFLRKRLTA